MATLQGVCKNCGSLIMFDDRDDKCECVFCNCVFPSSEAVEIMNNPEGVTFPNEVYEPSTDSKHHTTTRIYSDEGIKKTIKREELAKAQSGDSKLKPSEFEVSPSDVKAPVKTLSIIIGAVAIALILTIVISVPLYNSRKSNKNKIEENIAGVFAYSEEENLGYTIWGQTSENIKLVTSASISEDQANQIYDNYCQIRSDATGKNDGKVSMEIYCDGLIWTVTSEGASSSVDEAYEVQIEESANE